MNVPRCAATGQNLDFPYACLFRGIPETVLKEDSDRPLYRALPVVAVNEGVVTALRRAKVLNRLFGEEDSYGLLNGVPLEHRKGQFTFASRGALAERFPRAVGALDNLAQQERPRQDAMDLVKRELGESLVIEQDDYLCTTAPEPFYGYVLRGQYQSHIVRAECYAERMIPWLKIIFSEKVDGLGYDILRRTMNQVSRQFRYQVELVDRKLQVTFSYSWQRATERNLKSLQSLTLRVEEALRQARARRGEVERLLSR